MKINKIYLKTVFLSSFLFLGSCESLDMDTLDNPNNIQNDKINVDFVLNSVQVDFSKFFFEVSDDTRGVARMVNQFGTYTSAADPQDTQNQWEYAYANVLKDVKSVKAFAKKESIPYHEGIARVLESYTYVTLVDFYGDVPYTQALMGAENLNPSVDSGASVYDAMLANLDASIVLLSQPAPAKLPNDMYYGGDATKWIKLANSLKIKIYNNLRLTRDVSAPVNAIVASGNYMTSNADDFNFKYTSNNSPKDSRHPDYIAEYDGSPSFYLSNTYLKLLMQDKSVVDPRRRYFFYRQTSSAPSGATLPCATQPNVNICYIGAGTWGGGYWGRDHADNTGIPPDAAARAVVGLYPAGGRFDNSRVQPANTSTALNDAKGAGILNILDYSFVQFMLAELALTEAGVSGNPAALLDAGVNANITKVMGFRTDLQIPSPPTAAAPNGVVVVPAAPAVTAYKAAVTANYTAAATTADKLNVIIKEYYIAAWGNGLEAYNMYRRTGFPAQNAGFIGMQSPVTAAGSFIRSFFYPSNAVNNNTSIAQHPITKQVFWDNNAAGFID